MLLYVMVTGMYMSKWNKNSVNYLSWDFSRGDCLYYVALVEGVSKYIVHYRRQSRRCSCYHRQLDRHQTSAHLTIDRYHRSDRIHLKRSQCNGNCELFNDIKGARFQNSSGLF